MLLKADPKERRAIDRPLSWLVSVGGLILLLDQTAFRLGSVAGFAPWWNAIGTTLAVGFVFLVLTGPKLPMRVLRVIWWLVPALYLIGQATWVLGYTGADIDTGFPWLWTMDPAVITMLLFILQPLTAIGVGLIFSTMPALSAVLILGSVPTQVWLATPNQLSNIMYLVIFAAIRHQLKHLRATELEALRQRRRQVEAEAGLRQQAALERLVHDEVLSALSAAIHSGAQATPTLRSAAERAINALGEPIESDQDSTDLVSGAEAAELLSSHLREIDPQCAVRAVAIDGGFPAAVVAAMSMAAAEALRNSLRHAGENTSRLVRIAATTESLRVSVRDDGIGFVPDAASSRIGIARSIHGRMTEFGGSAQITSQAGRGTEVVLAWPM